MKITTGDRLHFGAFALGLEYTVRFGLKLTDEINGEMLLQAVEKTQLRYPYLSVTLHKNENDYYYENNPRPVVLHHTDERISLNTDISAAVNTVDTFTCKSFSENTVEASCCSC